MTTVFADNCPAMVTSASEKVRQRSLGSIPKTVISGRPSSSSPTLTHLLANLSFSRLPQVERSAAPMQNLRNILGLSWRLFCIRNAYSSSPPLRLLRHPRHSNQ